MAWKSNFISNLFYRWIVIGKPLGVKMSLVSSLIYYLYIRYSLKARSLEKSQERGPDGEGFQINTSTIYVIAKV